MKRRQRQGSDRRCPGSFKAAVLRVWSVELWMSLRPFHEIPEVKTIFLASLRYYLTSHMLTFALMYNLAVMETTEKARAPHSSTLTWRIPWTEKPGRLQSIGSLGVRHDWATSLLLFTFMHWRRKWQPTPVFLPWESQGQRSLVGCRLWGCTESNTTETT